jgi:hypothetical protein
MTAGIIAAIVAGATMLAGAGLWVWRRWFSGGGGGGGGGPTIPPQPPFSLTQCAYLEGGLTYSWYANLIAGTLGPELDVIALGADKCGCPRGRAGGIFEVGGYDQCPGFSGDWKVSYREHVSALPQLIRMLEARKLRGVLTWWNSNAPGKGWKGSWENGHDGGIYLMQQAYSLWLKPEARYDRLIWVPNGEMDRSGGDATKVVKHYWHWASVGMVNPPAGAGSIDWPELKPIGKGCPPRSQMAWAHGDEDAPLGKWGWWDWHPSGPGAFGHPPAYSGKARTLQITDSGGAILALYEGGDVWHADRIKLDAHLGYIRACGRGATVGFYNCGPATRQLASQRAAVEAKVAAWWALNK